MAKKKTANEYEINWEASEYIHHEKNINWYLWFSLATLLILTSTFLLLRDVVSTAVVGMMAVSILIIANRQPKSIKYGLNDEGVNMGSKNYKYSSFKSFSIMQTGAIESIYLEPLERFMPPISIYFEPNDGDKIVNILGKYLPHRERQPDLLDKLIHSIRL